MTKIYISCDIEGLAGIATFDMEKEDTKRFRDLYHQQLSWVIEGIQQSDKNDTIEEITVSDSHSRGVHLGYQELSQMDERISLINGFPRMDYMMSGLDKTYDLVIFLGYHAGIGKKYGNMDHGYSASVAYDLKINGDYVNETTINAAYATEVGVPVGLIIGESGLKEQLHDESMMPDVSFVTTKQSLGRYGIKTYPMKEIREAVIRETREAVNRKTSEIIKFAIETPAKVSLQCATTAQADRIEMLSSVQRIDGRTIEFTGDTMKKVMNDIVAIVGLGGTTY